jgi:hypothetical protein
MKEERGHLSFLATQDVEQQLVALACTDPPRGRCHWTLQLLTDALVVLGLVEAISRETVRQALKKTRLAN